MRFTVVTPTFNRAHTLPHLYDGLCRQTFQDFEWLIVDDGSFDGTRNLVADWSSFFPIRYMRKENGGKHTAMNLGVREAQGEFVAFIDSDDWPVPHALERFDEAWRQIRGPAAFSTCTALTCTPEGLTRGERLNAPYIDAYDFRNQYELRGRIDRWGINRTDVLREFPFPEGESFVPEGLVWNRMSRKYATRFINEALLVVSVSADSLTHRMVDLRARSPKATLTYYAELAMAPAPTLSRVRGALNFCRFAAIIAGRRITRSMASMSSRL